MGRLCAHVDTVTLQRVGVDEEHLTVLVVRLKFALGHALDLGELLGRVGQLHLEACGREDAFGPDGFASLYCGAAKAESGDEHDCEQKAHDRNSP